MQIQLAHFRLPGATGFGYKCQYLPQAQHLLQTVHQQNSPCLLLPLKIPGLHVSM